MGNDVENTNLTKFNLTKFNLQNKDIKILNKYNVQSNNDKLKNIQYNNPVIINEYNVIDIYDVNSYDQLYSWMKENLKFGNILTCKRVLNSWIRVNIKILRTHNNGLAKILDLLVNRYYNPEFLKNNNISSNDYVNYWIEKNINLSFHFDIFNDYNNYIKKIISDKNK